MSQFTCRFVLILIFVYICVWNMARTNLKYVRQPGLGKEKTIEQMRMERLNVVGYKDLCNDDNNENKVLDTDSDEIKEEIVEEGQQALNEEIEKEHKEEEDLCFDIKLKLPCRKIQESVHRFLFLRRKNNQHARQDLIYAKSPNDIKVSVKSKYDEFKCICEMKYEAHEELNKLAKLYRHWKN